jgi:hypothetical protein
MQCLQHSSSSRNVRGLQAARTPRAVLVQCSFSFANSERASRPTGRRNRHVEKKSGEHHALSVSCMLFSCQPYNTHTCKSWHNSYLPHLSPIVLQHLASAGLAAVPACTPVCILHTHACLDPTVLKTPGCPGVALTSHQLSRQCITITPCWCLFCCMCCCLSGMAP